ncbi:MAG: hypothetical protein MK193_15085 [Lentisphaeria bacterium]|nr:hypothetical protein [Lentisphaeria bacterium]NRB62790.1 hypothetical protein [Saprospiraceae bacterium]
MKKAIFILGLFLFGSVGLQAQEFKIVTVVESIVPAGLGRSRIIETLSTQDSDALTTERTRGNKSSQNKVRRRDVKVENLLETKLLNFYSLTGINFQNIASNDAVITDRLNSLAAEGWEIMFMTSGVESDAGETDGTGIFITRFLLKKN